MDFTCRRSAKAFTRRSWSAGWSGRAMRPTRPGPDGGHDRQGDDGGALRRSPAPSPRCGPQPGRPIKVGDVDARPTRPAGTWRSNCARQRRPRFRIRMDAGPTVADTVARRNGHPVRPGGRAGQGGAVRASCARKLGIDSAQRPRQRAGRPMLIEDLHLPACRPGHRESARPVADAARRTTARPARASRWPGLRRTDRRAHGPVQAHHPALHLRGRMRRHRAGPAARQPARAVRRRRREADVLAVLRQGGRWRRSRKCRSSTRRSTRTPARSCCTTVITSASPWRRRRA